MYGLRHEPSWELSFVPSVWIAFTIGPFASIHVNMLDLPANPFPHQRPPKLQSNRMFP